MTESEAENLGIKAGTWEHVDIMAISVLSVKLEAKLSVKSKEETVITVTAKNMYYTLRCQALFKY